MTDDGHARFNAAFASFDWASTFSMEKFPYLVGQDHHASFVCSATAALSLGACADKAAKSWIGSTDAALMAS